MINELLNNYMFPWLQSHGLQLLLILIVATIVHSFGKIFIEKLTRRLIMDSRYQSKEAETKREDTLIKIFSGGLSVVTWIMAGLMILSELGVDIGPLLAGAGIAGLAFGFGGQYLIRDLISGLFIIIENQYRVNDIVCFDATCGVVEDISMRMTTLRDLNGIVHHVPHGEIKIVSNMTKEYSRINLNIGVAYEADLEQVISVVNEVGQALAKDDAWKNKIISAPRFLRVEDFADSAVMIKILGDTKPAQQWAVTGELRKRLKIAFDQNNIDIPYPQRVINTTKAK